MSEVLNGLDFSADEIRGMEKTVACLALAGPALTPPPSLRARLLENLQPRTFLITRGSDSGWKRFPAPGIEFKHLMKDPQTGTRSFLLRMQPGAVLPPHHHTQAEHCYVVEGEVNDGEHSLTAGDYELRLPDSEHTAVTTSQGAVILIIAGAHDEH